MRLDQSVQTAVRHPLTSAIGLAAAGVSVAWWSEADISWMVPRSPVLASPWTLVLSTLPHANVAHLAFNLYWWWKFGSRVEAAWGPSALLGVFLLLATASSAAECALSESGVGLSGVVYGLASLLYLAQQRDAKLSGSVTRATLQLFFVWFLICIAATALDVMRIGNYAHGAGALFGGLLGRCIYPERGRRPAWLGALGAGTLAVLVGAQLGHPSGVASRRGERAAYEGYAALSSGRPDEAARLLEIAVHERPRHLPALTNLGIAYQQLGRQDDALRLYQQAIAVDPRQRPALAPAIASILQNRSHEAAASEQFPLALAAAEESLKWNARDPVGWRLLAYAKLRLNDADGAVEAYERAWSTGSGAAGGYDEATYEEEVAGAELRAKRYEPAVKRLREATKLHPDKGGLWLLLGHGLRNTGDAAGALAAFDRAATFPEQREEAASEALEIRRTIK